MTSSAALTEDQNSAVHWFWPQMIVEKSPKAKKKKPHTKNHCELGNLNVEFQTLRFNTNLNEFTSNSVNKTS